jgi:L-fuconolactonase
MIIDAHHHLWAFDPIAYDWIGPQDVVLRRDFLADNLAAMAAPSGLAGSIVVQARQSLEETEWLLGLARKQPLIRGVVGWAPLADPALPAILDALPPGPLVGLRHVVQGESDPQFLLRPGIQAGLAELARRNLAYDLLIKAAQLPQATRCVEQLPADMRFILDHGGKPDIRRRGLASWSADLTVLARHTNVACKLSGLVTETDPAAWTPAELEPYVRSILDAFGPQRVLFGSDWPVCLLGTEHRRWLDTVRQWIASYTPAEQAAILGGNALTWYRLESP